MNTCIFCNLKRSENWYDEILYETEHSYLIPALGSLVAGGVIIVSYEKIKQITRKFLNDKYGGYLFWEHIGCGCVNHPHINCYPKYLDLTDFNLESKNNNNYYIKIETSNQDGILNLKKDINQFMRKKLAIFLGFPEKYDYALYPFNNNISQTIKDFKLNINKNPLDP